MLGSAGPRPIAHRSALALVAGALLVLAQLLMPGLARAQTFPQLTGPVVDQATRFPTMAISLAGTGSWAPKTRTKARC